MREQAAEILYLDAAGYQRIDIARKLGLKQKDVETIRNVAGDGVIAALRDSGYSTGEICRTLGVPTARVLPPIAA